MSNKDKIGCLYMFLSFSIVTPIWYYLLYQILVTINASELLMFLFWIYVPVGVVLGISKGVLEQVFAESNTVSK